MVGDVLMERGQQLAAAWVNNGQVLNHSSSSEESEHAGSDPDEEYEDQPIDADEQPLDASDPTKGLGPNPFTPPRHVVEATTQLGCG